MSYEQSCHLLQAAASPTMGIVSADDDKVGDEPL
jgi:hypothetical protein